MANKIVNLVLAGVFAYAWYYVGTTGYYGAEVGGIGDDYFFVTIATIALMRA